MLFAAGTVPELGAMGIFFDDGVAIRAINASAVAIGILLEILFTGRAIPEVVADDSFRRIVSGRTDRAVPVTVFATFVKCMCHRVARTIPGVIAMRLVGSSVVRLLVGTVPMMYATDRRRIGGSAVAFFAVPIPVITGFTHRMVRCTAGTPPIMRAVCFFRQRGIAADAEAAVMVAISVNVIRLFAGRTIPIMIAVDGR